jgi:hypothetical protein
VFKTPDFHTATTMAVVQVHVRTQNKQLTLSQAAVRRHPAASIGAVFTPAQVLYTKQCIELVTVTAKPHSTTAARLLAHQQTTHA